MSTVKQARELNQVLEPLLQADCPNVRNEAAQLMVITLNADTQYPPEQEEIEEVRERTEALLKGIKHQKRVDIKKADE